MKSTRYCVAIFVAALSTAGSRATIDARLQMQLGDPSAATADPTNHQHYLIQRPQYALDYDDSTEEPNWVSWDLTAGDVGASGRSNSFNPDTSLPAGFYEVTTADYNGVGSTNPVYNRGHMCPSEDRTDTKADNVEVFLMSNIVPQSADNNQGPWELFEEYCRTQASAGNEVLIISGPSGFNGPYSFVDSSFRLPSGKVSIPSYTWKIAVFVPPGSGTALSRITAATPVIAIKIPNLGGIVGDPWQKYVASVAQIQTDTGFTFFSALDPSIAAAFMNEIYGQSTGTPIITAQPAPQTAPVGGSATFTVTATGNATLAYQWSKDGTPIAGATSATLTLANIQVSDGGNYTVTVTNSVGSIASNPAALSISGIPPSIPVQPASRTVAAGSGTVFAVTAAGSPNLTYQWFKDGTALTDAGTHYGSITDAFTITDAQAGDAGVYTVVVTNPVKSVTSSGATLGVTQAGPTITTQPASQTIASGATAVFSVTAGGSPAYQWYLNNNAIAGATGFRLVVSGATAADAGSYTCVVSNASGSSTSAPATLAVAATANPGRLINLSCLTEIATGAGLDLGFVVGGSTAKTVLVRVGGPALNSLNGNTGVMADPQLQISPQSSPGTILAFNAGWGGDPQIASAAASVGAYAFPNPNSLDSAALVTLPPGAYVVQTKSTSGAGGTVLVEIYDVP